MRDPKDAPPIGELLESDSFAGVAKAIQVVMGDQLHVFYFLIVRRHRASSYNLRKNRSSCSKRSNRSIYQNLKSEYRNRNKLHKSKSEIRSTKSETNRSQNEFKIRKSKTVNSICPVWSIVVVLFCIILNLFRAS
jgi:hypothetical protein